MTIPFNIPPVTGAELTYIQQAIANQKISGDGEFTRKCHSWLQETLPCHKALLTTSCTHALEMAAILIDIKHGDEVIMPSYTFVSTANAFALRGAKIIFVDIRPDTMNMDETLLEAAITPKTKAIVPVHYAGVACKMDAIMGVAAKYDLFVIEDAAQGVTSTYRKRTLGTFGHLGCYSFHETKNYVCGEGGALIINDKRLIERAEIIREKGTNRSRFFRGQVDKYSWVDIGSSYLPSELNAAYLLAQLERSDEILKDRLQSWNLYYTMLTPLWEQGLIELPIIPADCEHNAHMFYIKARDLEERTHLIDELKQQGIMCVFHYIPLHSAEAGIQYGRFSGNDSFTTTESERLVRLPLYYNIGDCNVKTVVNAITKFYTK
jgi:dTDP-4-amino-4,6-dideoxygalactose transaminase